MSFILQTPLMTKKFTKKEGIKMKKEGIKMKLERIGAAALVTILVIVPLLGFSATNPEVSGMLG